MKNEEDTKGRRFKNPFRTIHSKLIAGMLAISLIPAIALGGYLYIQIQQQLVSIKSTDTLTLTKEINNGIENYLEGFESNLNALANNHVFSELHIHSNTNNRENAIAVLKNIFQSRNDILTVYFASQSKDIITQPEADLGNDFDPTTRDWYKQAVKADGKIAITNPYQDADTKKMIVTISKAVKYHDTIVGVVGIDLDLADIEQHVSKSKFGKEGYVILTDNNGTIIAHPDEDKLGTSLEENLFHSIKGNHDGTFSYKNGNEETFVSYDKNELSNWYVIGSMSSNEFTKDLNHIKFASIAIFCLILLIAPSFTIFFSRRISKNVNEINDMFKIASEGDFTVRLKIHSNDEFKSLETSFNSMMGNISEILKQAQNSSEEILNTSKSLSEMTNEVTESTLQVATSIDEIAKGNSSQAQDTQEGVEEINVLSLQLDNISDIANEVDEASKDSTVLSQKGIEEVKLLSEKSKQTKESAIVMSQTIEEVVESINKIHTMVDTIKGITEQTNLLALNASIEAARAGEYGKGFAVVAEEIRKLAEQSKQSAEEIRNNVVNITTVTQNAVDSMESTMKVIDEQDVLVMQTRELFERILNAVQLLHQKVVQTKASIDEVKYRKNNIVEKMENISAVSEQTASSSQEVSASAEEISATMEEFAEFAKGLRTLSEQLSSEIKKFKIK